MTISSTEYRRLLRQVTLFGEGSLNELDRWRFRAARQQPVADVREPVGPEDICFDCPSPHPGESRERFMVRCMNAMHGHNGATADVAREACELTWHRRREQARAVADVVEPAGPKDICYDCPTPNPGESEEKFLERCMNAV